MSTYSQPELNRMWLDGNITAEEYAKLSRQAADEAFHGETNLVYLPETTTARTGWAKPAMPVPLEHPAADESDDAFWVRVGARV